VVQLVTDWASRHDVRLSQLMDHRARTRTQEATTATEKPRQRTQPSVTSDVVRLRTKLHQIIDIMPLTELAELPIPAQYLLLDR
jgi:hypothetical protein